MLHCNLCNFFHGFHCQAVACRIAWSIDKQSLRTLVYHAFQTVGVNLEILLLIGWHLYRYSPCQLNLLRIRSEVRCLNKYLITIVQNCLHNQVHAVACRRCDVHLFIGDLHTVFLFVEFYYFLSELWVSLKIRVFRMSCLCICKGLVDYQRICDKIRISKAQVNYIVKSLRQNVRLTHCGALILPVSFRYKLMFHDNLPILTY